MYCRMNRVECRYADMNGYCDSTACHNMNVVGNILPNERPENISNSSIWVKPQSNWHKGTPTENGWYLFSYKYLDTIRYGTDCFLDGKWVFNPALDEKMLAWQKIEPFKEG